MLCVFLLLLFFFFLFLFLMHTSCVFFLCIHMYLEGPIYLEGSICFEGSYLVLTS
jgi:hypothetical protein